MEGLNNFAPVLIPTLSRFEHFKRCVESLSNCTYAEKTDLFIALDYPFDNTHWEGYNKIVRFIPEIKGFNNVIVQKRNTNYGAKKKLYDARNQVFEKYDRLIVSEDDNEFSPNF